MPRDHLLSFHLKCGPIKLFKNYSIELTNIKNPTWDGIIEAAVHTSREETYIYFQIKKDLSDNPLNQLVENSINISIINQEPVFNLSAGVDQELPFPAVNTILNGSVDTSSLPESTHLLYQWSFIDGPGLVIFKNSNLLNTTSSFSIPGVYELRLRAGNPLISNYDDVTIIIQPEILIGDVNNDGFVDIKDALLVAQYYVGIRLVSIVEEAGDVNKDGNLNIIDALLIAQFYVGLIDDFSNYQF